MSGISNSGAKAKTLSSASSTEATTTPSDGVNLTAEIESVGPALAPDEVVSTRRAMALDILGAIAVNSGDCICLCCRTLFNDLVGEAKINSLLRGQEGVELHCIEEFVKGLACRIVLHIKRSEIIVDPHAFFI